MNPIRHVLCIGWLTLAAFQAPVAAQTVVIEAETFQSCHDIDHDPVSPIGTYLWGLDCPDEWAEYDLTISEPSFYSVHTTARGDAGVPCTLRVIFTATSSGNTRECDLVFVGTGMT